MSSNLVTPRILSERIIRLSNRGNQSRDSELDDREVIAIVVDISNKLSKADIYRTRGEEGKKAPGSHYIHTFRKVPVQVLTSGGVNFITLPAKYANLPLGVGVQSIRPNTGNPFANKAMIPVNSGEMDIYEDIVGSVQNQWVFFPEGDKVYFRERCGKTLCQSEIKYVDVKLVVILGDVSPDSPLQVPPELHYDILMGALDVLGPTYGLKQVKDKVNDNNPDTLES